MADPATTVTLVHGTFARGAAWTRPDSAMRTEWPTSPERPVVFTVFEWSGENSHEARQTAASDLAAHLRKVAAAHKDAAHLVIAHSHGGNVALAAMAQEEVRSRVAAIACLNTPFISCEARSLVPAVIALLACNPFVWLMLGTPVVLERYLIPRYPGQFMKAVLIGSGLMIAAAIPAALAGFRIWGLSERVLAAIEGYQRRRADAFRGPDHSRVRIFPATVKRDEAYRYLSTLDRLTNATASGLLVSKGLFFGGIGLYLIAGSGGFLTDFNWFPSLTRAALMLSRFALYLAAAGFAAFVLSVILMTIAGMLLRGHRYGYGEALGDSLLLHIGVTAYPPGGSPADVRVFDGESAGLHHSALYGSAALVRALADWFQAVPGRDSSGVTPGASPLPG
jgi:hypothetical protein